MIYAMVPLLAGCDGLDPCGGDEYVSFAVVRHGTLPNGTPTLGSTAPVWGGTEVVTPVDELLIVFPDDDALPPDVLELVTSDGIAVALSGEDRFVPTNDEACSHNERSYALGTIAVGDYTLIHRRKNGTGDPLNCVSSRCPWTAIDGSEAVTLMLAIR